MATVSKLKNMLEILEKNGHGNQMVSAEHDMIYLSTEPEDAPFADELKKAGASYGDSDGWYTFV